MKNKKVLIPLMNGFEETEYIAVRDVMIREGIDVYSVSLTGEKLIVANHNTIIGSDLVFGNQTINVDEYDAIFIPGGLIGVENLDKSLHFDKIINDFFANNKIIAAICAAPILLAKRNMLKNKDSVVYPDKKLIQILKNNKVNYIEDKEFVISDNIITGKDMQSSIIFGYALSKFINNNKK